MGLAFVTAWIREPFEGRGRDVDEGKGALPGRGRTHTAGQVWRSLTRDG